MEGADRVAGERWTDSGGDCGGCGQEPADGPSVASPLRGERDGRAVEGCDPPLARQAVGAREDQAGGRHDAAYEAAERDPLEPAQHGRGCRALLQQCPTDMACARAQAASGQNVQSLARQELRGQGGGRGWALPRSTRQSAGLLRRRKKPNPSPRPHATGIAHEEGGVPVP